jgi:DDHD domain
MFLKRNRNFKGKVSLAGHSLGSLILFDLLCHQKPHTSKPDNFENLENQIRRPTPHKPLQRTQSKQIDYRVGLSGTGQPLMNYPQLTFEPKNFFALGSPIGMFVTIRGIDKLGMDFRLPTCDGFYNIFHPYDPVAYRLEALVNPMLAMVPPFLIPHHKGRKRMHLELKETMNRVSTDIKSKFMTSFKNVTETVCALNPLLKNINQRSIENEVNEVLAKQLDAEKQNDQRTGSREDDPMLTNPTLALGQLNQAKRLDYVLQEAPLEFFNEYLFALTSHVCYWDSADTILFIVKEIYSSMGVEADQEVPQHTLKIERPGSSDVTQSTSMDKR